MEMDLCGFAVRTHLSQVTLQDTFFPWALVGFLIRVARKANSWIALVHTCVFGAFARKRELWILLCRRKRCSRAHLKFLRVLNCLCVCVLRKMCLCVASPFGCAWRRTSVCLVMTSLVAEHLCLFVCFLASAFGPPSSQVDTRDHLPTSQCAAAPCDCPLSSSEPFSRAAAFHRHHPLEHERVPRNMCKCTCFVRALVCLLSVCEPFGKRCEPFEMLHLEVCRKFASASTENASNRFLSGSMTGIRYSSV